MKLVSRKALFLAASLAVPASAWVGGRKGLARVSVRRRAALAIQSDHGGGRSTIDVDVCGDGSKILTFETGVIGKQAAGAAIVTCGGTVVYTTACYSPKSTPILEEELSGARPPLVPANQFDPLRRRRL